MEQMYLGVKIEKCSDGDYIETPGVVISEMGLFNQYYICVKSNSRDEILFNLSNVRKLVANIKKHQEMVVKFEMYECSIQGIRCAAKILKLVYDTNVPVKYLTINVFDNLFNNTHVQFVTCLPHLNDTLDVFVDFADGIDMQKMVMFMMKFKAHKNITRLVMKRM